MAGIQKASYSASAHKMSRNFAFSHFSPLPEHLPSATVYFTWTLNTPLLQSPF